MGCACEKFANFSCKSMFRISSLTKEKWSFVFYLAWFSYLIISAVSMFGNGFLLSRKTLSDVSECVPLERFDCDGHEREGTGMDWCSQDDKIRRILSVPGGPMACTPVRNRVVFLLVDSLRYDFTEFDGSVQDPLPYQNRLPVMRKTLDKYPERTRLFRFMADPPTTTLQRVKALVTGSLPTFIDVSSNFAAMELQEDNVIDQLVKGGGKAVLLGDDTWGKLIPGKWLRSHAMYSFHTWDLDTVDNEVDSKIYTELQKDDWTLLVAHYLGVDHAGHRYGPMHSEMTRKLNETNSRIEKVIEMLPPDVVLYIVGDHGMTENGDHGGESRAERTAALFAYSAGGLGGSSPPLGMEVGQTDLAPTLSAALGRPPPAPSLGNILFSVLPKSSATNMLLHLTNSLKQITQYLVRYGEESQQISLDRLAQLINATREQIDKASRVQTNVEMEMYAADVRALIDDVRAVFREVWVEFDSLSMLRALLLMFIAIFFNWLITEGIPMESLPAIFASTFVSTGIVCITSCVLLSWVAYYLEITDNLEHAICLSVGLVSGAITSVLVILHWDAITDKWYTGRSRFYERFSRSCLIVSAAALASNSYIIEEGASLSFLALTVLGLMAWNIATVKAAVLWASCGVVLALSRNYRGCREEQGDCWTKGLGGNTGQTSRAALVLALGTVAAVVATARKHLGWRGHGIVVAGMLACAHWATGWGTLGSISRSRLLARLSWLVLATMFALIWRRDSPALIPITVTSLLLFVGNTLVMGAASAPAAVLAVLTGFLALGVVAMLRNDASSKFSLSARCNSSVACLWALLATYHFYGTGHHATLGHVRWHPAFHAGDPNHLGQAFAPVVTGALVMLDQFGMPLLFGASVPLLALWGDNGSSSPRTQMVAVFSLCLKFSLCFAVRVFASALAATIHCRHLMIWGVFTPKLLFEAGACVSALVGMLLGAALTAWHLPTVHRSS